MKTISKTTIGNFAISFLLLLTACSENKQQAVSDNVQVKAVSTTVAEKAEPAPDSTAAKPEESPAIATIIAPEYEATIHRAIAFFPKDDGLGLMKIKQDHRYVVLDMSVKHTAKNKEVDMGQILLSAKVRDEKGREYSMNAMAVAAYTLENPNPHHQAQYNQLWGKLKPGDSLRTTVYGIEVPVQAKNFVLSLKEDGDVFKESKRHEVKFSVD